MEVLYNYQQFQPMKTKNYQKIDDEKVRSNLSMLAYEQVSVAHLFD